jgi:hypothetical protein
MEMPKMPVYFACPDCHRLYLASQVHRAGAGRFDCVDCGKPVHQWSGSYDFTGWKPA